MLMTAFRSCLGRVGGALTPPLPQTQKLRRNHGGSGLTDESVCPTLVHRALGALWGRRFRLPTDFFSASHYGSIDFSGGAQCQNDSVQADSNRGRGIRGNAEHSAAIFMGQEPGETEQQRIGQTTG